MAPGPG
ncbi:hypothetical protein ECNE037_5520, partial [Escherichia coli NE037]